MFNPQTNSFTGNYFQQQAAINPFSLGSSFGSQPVQMQQTGFLVPQTTAFQPSPQQHNPHNPFGHLQQQYQPSLAQPQPTGFVQPQITGLNPFRQNSLSSQTTGLPPLSSPPAFNGAMNAFQFHDNGQLDQQLQQASNPFPFTATNIGTTSSPTSIPSNGTAFTPAVQQSLSGVPPRPASAPLSSLQSTMSSVHFPPEPAPLVKTHQTGSRNPFGVPTMPPPPVPKVPTLMELAIGMQQTNNSQPQPQSTGSNGLNLNGSGSPTGTKLSTKPSSMSSVASDFTFLKLGERAPSSFPSLESSSSPQSTSTTAIYSSETSITSIPSLSTGTTINTNASSSNAPSISISSPGVKSHVTGVFTGLKAFKPTSSFGAQLLETLPPIPQSEPGTPAPPSEEPFSAYGTSPTSLTGPDASKPGVVNISSSSFGSGLGALGTQQNSLGAQSSGLGSLNTHTTGSFGRTLFGNASTAGGGGSMFDGAGSLNPGLRPQTTGAAGAANPFRASTFGGGPPTGQSNGTPFGTASVNAPMFSNVTGVTGFPSTGTNAFNGGPGTFGQNQIQQPQQPLT
jgi:phosphatidylinositol-binding clathrin assembly protein